MVALEALATPTKNQLFPIISMRPWLTARSFDRACQRVEEAIGDRLYGFDIDASRRGRRDGEAFEVFDTFFNAVDGYRKYYNFLESWNAVPVLRTQNGQVIEAEKQIENAVKLERGLVVRVNVLQPINVTQIAEQIAARELPNVVFVFDCGWHDGAAELNLTSARCVPLVRLAAAVSPEFELVVGGGSFPTNFTNQGDTFFIPSGERTLFDNVRREVNANIVYGDWASTRPPPTDAQIRRGAPRIDVAEQNGWRSWRGSNDNDRLAEYRRLAFEVSEALNLGELSDLWGEQMIIATRSRRDPSIKSPAMAAAVRVNLHLNLQTYFDDGGQIELGDELVEDEIL